MLLRRNILIYISSNYGNFRSHTQRRAIELHEQFFNFGAYFRLIFLAHCGLFVSLQDNIWLTQYKNNKEKNNPNFSVISSLLNCKKSRKRQAKLEKLQHFPSLQGKMGKWIIRRLIQLNRVEGKNAVNGKSLLHFSIEKSHTRMPKSESGWRKRKVSRRNGEIT